MNDQQASSNVTSMFRAPRIYRTKPGWSIATREGPKGPFATKEKALQYLVSYKKKMGDSVRHG